MKKKVFPFLRLSVFLLFLFGLLLIDIQAQTASNNREKTITGIVADVHGEPLIGVNVMQKGTTRGTVTDFDGKYAVDIAGGNVILTFSYIGFSSQEITVGSKKQLNVVLQEDNQALDEVVVIGYGTARKRDLTGAVSTVKAEKLAAEAPRNVQDLLRANSAGLSVGMATTAQGDSKLQIRGKNSLKANTEPLIVLDGVIYEGSMDDINPMDIESVDILKDASSAAVYGAKSANGVVIINTKRGKTGKPVINFNSNIGFVNVGHQQELYDPAGFIGYRQDYHVGRNTDEYNAKYPQMFTDPTKLDGLDALTWYNYDQKTPVTSVTDEQLTRSFLSRLTLSGPEIENYLIGNTTDWADEVFQTGLQQDYTASISNKTDNMSYYWSMGYSDREGFVAGDSYSTFRTRLNLESKITNFLTVGINSSFSSKDESAMPVPWELMTTNTPYGSNEINNPDASDEIRAYPSGKGYARNPFYENSYRDKRSFTNTMNANIYAKVKLPFGFEYQMNFIPRYNWYENYAHDSSQNFEWEAKGGSASRETSKQFSWQIDNIIRWNKQFNKVHNFDVTLLANAEKLQSWQQKMSTSQFSPSDILGWHAMQSGSVPLNTSDDQYQTGDALMARLFYSYNNKYMITASVRRDGYSAFGQENPRATFPSLAGGWIFTSEKFMESASSWFNYGKLRFSWGENGNRGIGRYDALSDMKSSPHPYIDQNGNVYITSQLYVNKMSNSSLKWERTGAYNLGLDFSLFDNVLSGSLEGYLSTTNDLLVDRALPEIIGFSSVAANLGQISNKGFEATLNANIIEKKNFGWNSSVNFSLNRREIKKLYGDMVPVFDSEGNKIGEKEADDTKNKWFIGQDPDRIWSYESDGIWQVDEAEEAAIYGLQPGDFKYKDINEDGVMTDDDKTFQEYTTPRFRWTWRNEFNFYQNFSLSFMMYSYWGQHGDFNRAANSANYPDRASDYIMPHWMPDNPIDDYARIGSKNTGTVYREKSFIRLDNITVSYRIPQSFLKKISVQDMRLSGSVRNVACFAPGWDFWDPEVGNPAPRTFNLSVNFTL